MSHSVASPGHGFVWGRGTNDANNYPLQLAETIITAPQLAVGAAGIQILPTPVANTIYLPWRIFILNFFLGVPYVAVPDTFVIRNPSGFVGGQFDKSFAFTWANTNSYMLVPRDYSAINPSVPQQENYITGCTTNC